MAAADAAAARLLAWLRASGGLVDGAISVGVSTTSGRRGLIATRRLEATARPLVAVPEPLVLTPPAAATALAHFHGAPPGLGPALAALDPSLPLAVLLAVESSSPPRPSPWGLYALALDNRPPAGWWAAAGADMDTPALAAAGVPADKRPAWTKASAATRAAAEGLAAQAAALVERRGRRRLHAPPLTPAAVAWGLGHVVSRAFRMPATPTQHAGGGGGCPVLLPVIDLANHAPGAAEPAWAEAPGAPHRFATLRAAGAAAGEGRAPRALEAGDELATSYAATGNGGALEWWLNYGFVPEEVSV